MHTAEPAQPLTISTTPEAMEDACKLHSSHVGSMGHISQIMPHRRGFFCFKCRRTSQATSYSGDNGCLLLVRRPENMKCPLARLAFALACLVLARAQLEKKEVRCVGERGVDAGRRCGLATSTAVGSLRGRQLLSTSVLRALFVSPPAHPTNPALHPPPA